MKCQYSCDRLYTEFCEAILRSHSEVEEEALLNCATALVTSDAYYNQLSESIRKSAAAELVYRLQAYDFITPFLKMETVQEIMINGPTKMFVEMESESHAYDINVSEERLMSLIQKIVSQVNRSVNLKTPIVDARLSDGSRVNIVLQPIALNGPIITIRKFRRKFNDLETLVKAGAMSYETAKQLADAVKNKKNIFISGSTSSGKTTLLNALCHYIGAKERVITIEDSAELDFSQVENLVQLETRPDQSSSNMTIDAQILIKSALRMRPDRIVLGEIRGKEAYDMLQAMNTGHEGSLSTGHANSAMDMVQRIIVMAMSSENANESSIHKQIYSGIDWIVHLTKTSDGQRRIEHIVELSKGGDKGMQSIEKMTFAEGWRDVHL